jgi:hypothetical protein
MSFRRAILLALFVWALCAMPWGRVGDLSAGQIFARGGGAGFAPYRLADVSPAKPAVAQRVDKHGGRGIACDACHGKAVPPAPVPTEKCFGCHGSYEALASKTHAIPDPHKSHLGELDCDKCHKEHGASVFFCNKCHVFTMNAP